MAVHTCCLAGAVCSAEPHCLNVQLPHRHHDNQSFFAPVCRSVDTIRNAGWGAEPRSAVSTERRWQSSLCRRGTSGSRRLVWSSLCRASSSSLSRDRIVHIWRRSISRLCHRQSARDKTYRSWVKSIKDSNSVVFAKYSATNVLIIARWLDK